MTALAASALAATALAASVLAASVLAAMSLPAAAAAPPAPDAASGPRLYEMSTETGMPHLETSLRHAVRHERRCLDPQDLSSAFWMLQHESLQGCTLVKAAQQPGAATYRLHCDGGRGTSGIARWQLGPGRIAGTLDVRLGGKNMTFYQRVSARPLGPCR